MNWFKRRLEKRRAVKDLVRLGGMLHSPEYDELVDALKRDPLLFGCDMDDYSPEQRARLEKARGE